jgi:hypothetical protein
LTTLVLDGASASRPSGEWKDEDYDVLADGRVVGRVGRGARKQRMWTSGHDGQGSRAGHGAVAPENTGDH